MSRGASSGRGAPLTSTCTPAVTRKDKEDRSPEVVADQWNLSVWAISYWELRDGGGDDRTGSQVLLPCPSCGGQLPLSGETVAGRGVLFCRRSACSRPAAP